MTDRRKLSIRIARNKKERETAFRIRSAVFVKEQKVPVRLEIDEYDKDAKHTIMYCSGKPMGCARVVFRGGVAKLGRIAILKRYRGMGFGKAMLGYLVRYCKRRKAGRIVLGAQLRSVDFYRKSGFVPHGKVFMDAGIRHVGMHLDTAAREKAGR